MLKVHTEAVEGDEEASKHLNIYTLIRFIDFQQMQVFC